MKNGFTKKLRKKSVVTSLLSCSWFHVRIISRKNGKNFKSISRKNTKTHIILKDRYVKLSYWIHEKMHSHVVLHKNICKWVHKFFFFPHCGRVTHLLAGSSSILFQHSRSFTHSVEILKSYSYDFLTKFPWNQFI